MWPSGEDLPTTSKPALVNRATFESYLQPKKTFQKSQTRLLKFDQLPKSKKPNLGHSSCNKSTSSLRSRQVNAQNNWQQLRKVCHSLRLPPFLDFLRARNDDGLCKRKTGFEIYCEMASIHGFVNFVGAKTWERIFWCLTVAAAILMSAAVLMMSHNLTVDTPVTMYTESTYHPAGTIPFPAVTICNLNRISVRKSEALTAQIFSFGNVTKPDLLQLFRLSLFQPTELNAFERVDVLQKLIPQNLTLQRVRNEIAPDCSEELMRCKWQGRWQRCEKLFQFVDTPQGKCCAFNYLATSASNASNTPLRASGCGYKTGLTILLDPRLEDYRGTGFTWMAGYQVMVHDALDFAADSVERQFVPVRTEASLKVVPQRTYGTEYLRSESIRVRRCYFAGERRLSYFPHYTQTNCLSECRSQMMVETCGCSPVWSRLGHANTSEECSLDQAACVVQHKDLFHRLLIEQVDQRPFKGDRYAEAFICDCLPRCSFNQYTTSLDVATLNRNYSFGDKRFFKDISISNHVLLHVFYGDLIAQKFRLDVHESWLSFVSTFGGIAGLHMGYSFVSCFEMVFFVFVRPFCNWLTKKKIRYRNKRKQRKMAVAMTQKPVEQVTKQTPTKLDH